MVRFWSPLIPGRVRHRLRPAGAWTSCWKASTDKRPPSTTPRTALRTRRRLGWKYEAHAMVFREKNSIGLLNSCRILLNFDIQMCRILQMLSKIWQWLVNMLPKRLSIVTTFWVWSDAKCVHIVDIEKMLLKLAAESKQNKWLSPCKLGFDTA